jgi:hypothetical protein
MEESRVTEDLGFSAAAKSLAGATANFDPQQRKIGQ